MPEAHRPQSVRARTVLGFVLFVLFYLFGVALAALLIGAAVFVVVDGHAGFVAFLLGLGGVLTLVAIAPRPQRFTPPGPRVSSADQPELLALVDEVAAASGARPPDDVFLSIDANAGVTEHGPRRRRALVIGLPLLVALDDQQLRAILAHEYAHYAGGDTRAARWTWRTQQALARAMAPLEDDGASWLRKAISLPFHLFALVYLRVTAAVSRREEYVADAAAARLYGAGAFADALREVAVTSVADVLYTRSFLLPVLGSGVRPPFVDGMERFRAAALDSAVVDELLQAQLEAETGPRDTHPSLSDRLAALGGPAPEGADRPTAIRLVRDRPGVERELAMALGLGGLPVVPWERVGDEALAPMVRASFADEPPATRLTLGPIGDLGLLVAEPTRMLQAPGLAETDQERAEFVAHAGIEALDAHLASALVAGLTAAGWHFDVLPGQPPTLRHDDHTLSADDTVEALRNGTLTIAAWRAQATELGIADLPLGAD
jgi:heat shock protein HtpX